VASSLLAVDDSVTMRKIFEITFAGTDFQIATADGPDAALAKLGSDKPDLVLVDAGESAGGGRELANGYALCKRIKDASPTTRVLLLSSKQHPYDASAGEQAGADDQADKPFDTQQMLDRVRKLLAAPAPSAKTAPVASGASAAPARPAPAPMRPQAPAAAPVERPRTLAFTPSSGTPAVAAPAPVAAFAPKPAAQPVAQRAAPTPVQGNHVQPRPAAPAPPGSARTMPAMDAAGAESAKAPSVTAQVSQQMAAQLEGLGLTPAQVDAVLALSREVVERVVWEVVPVLAETIIKEEIARLTK
jgi:CheY-like chemotaxis protein